MVTATLRRPTAYAGAHCCWHRLVDREVDVQSTWAARPTSPSPVFAARLPRHSCRRSRLSVIGWLWKVLAESVAVERLGTGLIVVCRSAQPGVPWMSRSRVVMLLGVGATSASALFLSGSVGVDCGAAGGASVRAALGQGAEDGGEDRGERDAWYLSGCFHLSMSCL